VFYALAVGRVISVLSRRAQPTTVWAIILLSMLAAGACFGTIRARSGTTETVIEVKMPGAEGTVLTTSYQGLVGLDLPKTLAVPSGTASTVFSGRPLFGSVPDPVDNVSPILPAIGPVALAPVARGLGGGSVISGGGHPGVRLAARPWELRTVQSVSVDEGGPRLQAKLRLTGASTTSPTRVHGTLTNNGPAPIREMRAQTQDGQARLFDLLAPGETKAVDAPILTFGRVAADRRGAPPSAEDAVMFAAASRAFTGPDQVVVAGITESTRKAGTRRVSAVVIAVPIEAADTIADGSGGARPISTSPWTAADRVATSDLRAPPGTGPLSISYLLDPLVPGRPPPTTTREVYNWTTGTWRPLPTTYPGASHGIIRLEQPEVNNGRVRFRARSDEPIFLATAAQLSLTKSQPTGFAEL